jgi:hypothetical protein
MSSPAAQRQTEPPRLRALPGDQIHGVMWRVADRTDLEKLVWSSPAIARPLLTAARLLSAIEPILRYQRRADVVRSETSADVTGRLVDVWAAGEAAASLGLAAARQLASGNDQPVAEMLSLSARLWASVEGSAAMHDGSRLLGGEALPDAGHGLLPAELLEAQCKAAGTQDDSLLRHQLCAVISSDVCLEQLRDWMGEMKKIAALRADSGACAVGSAMDLWLWTMGHFQKLTGGQTPGPHRQPNIGPLADALAWLLAARCQILDVVQLVSRGADDPRLADEVGRISAELVFGYTLHPTWDPDCDACLQAEEIEALEAVMPGISYGARLTGDVMEQDGSHPVKAGPCARPDRFQGFVHRRTKLDGCLSGARLARDQAAAALTDVALPDTAV